MSGRVYPPWNYECQYQDHCPHLDGLSTRWVWAEYQEAHVRDMAKWRIYDEYDTRLGELEVRTKELEKENSELKAKLQALHRRQFKANRKKEGAPGTGKDSKGDLRGERPAEKKRGAPVGHPGWFRRKPSRVDRTVEVPAPNVCPHCQSEDLDRLAERTEHIQEDIVIQPTTVVTRYLHEQSLCKSCDQVVVKAGEGELLNAHIGPVAKSLAVYLRHGMRIPYRKVQELFHDVFGLNFVPASALGFDRKAARNGEALYEDLREKVKASAVVHADETSWRNNGLGHYAWYAGNPDLAFFHIDRHRSSEVATSILGTSFGGTLITDRYAAYNATNPHARQTCLAHLMRRAKEISAELLLMNPEMTDGKALTFCKNIAALFSKACAAGRKRVARGGDSKTGDSLANGFLRKLDKLCSKELDHKDAETLRSQLIGKERNHLFTFLRIPNVEPTNNQAEQSIRHIVIFRKIIYGNRSPDGPKTFAILQSLLLTAQRQGKHPRQFLETLFVADTTTAQEALYANSS